MKIVKYTNEYSHLANLFDCGNSTINKFLNSKEALDYSNGITYILLSDDGNKIAGYYNIGVSQLNQVYQVNGKQYSEVMGGAAKINYLALSEGFKHFRMSDEDEHYYLGDYLLLDCEERILELQKHIGFSYIIICSTEEGYHLYHDRNEYEDFEDDMDVIVSESDQKCYFLYKYIGMEYV